MKAVLEFNLPEEEPEFRTAINGARFMSVLWDLDQEMRSCLKYDAAPMDKNFNDTTRVNVSTTTQHWRSRLYALMEEEGVTFDE